MAAKGGRIDFMFLGPPLPGRWIRYCHHIIQLFGGIISQLQVGTGGSFANYRGGGGNAAVGDIYLPPSMNRKSKSTELIILATLNHAFC